MRSTGEVAVELQDVFGVLEGMEHQTAQHWADRMQAVLKGGHHAKVPAAATHSPEEVRVLRVTRHSARPVSGDDVDGGQVVRHEPVFVSEPAMAATEGETGDAGIGDDAPRSGQAERLRLAVQLTPSDAGLRADRPSHGIDSDALHARQVDDQPAVANAGAGKAVGATAHRHQQGVVTGEVDSVDDIGYPGGPDDQARAAVDIRVPDLARLFVATVVRSDKLAAQGLLELVDGFCRELGLATRERRNTKVRHGFLLDSSVGDLSLFSSALSSRSRLLQSVRHPHPAAGSIFSKFAFAVSFTNRPRVGGVASKMRMLSPRVAAGATPWSSPRPRRWHPASTRRRTL